MKSNFKNIALLALATLAFASCTTNENTTPAPPTKAAFIAIREQGVKKNTQNFTATAGTGVITLTSAKGVTIKLDGNALTKNGNPVTGAIDITFIELFDKGNMLIANKPTMGVMPDGKKSLLKSGGEFFIKASQGGVDLATTGTIQLLVPSNLTGTAIDTGMTFWAGDTKDDDNLAWVRPGGAAGGGKDGAVGFNQNGYTVTFGNFGWTNVDKFYSDPRPRTTILASVPTGYNNTNSAIYLSYDGEGQNALAKLDTYNPTTLQFSEHYGQIPIGLQMHIIFATEDNGNWRYAIKAVTVQANDVYTFTLSETTLGTEAQLVAAINAIQ
ncbi:hypothetical protein E0I61_01010 [Flavobacterium ranwuense]|uniref:Lipoprotein n=1 Tax=Flavobacterium ranwuense TaxID=2541725 RepID=A0ABY2DUC2_9FLAO|nr:hypothetical protein [Flavobacterium ranwuense]TDE31313.1 hypothetical protein E0I61_01010 [Flavobacterium ranwuense]